MSLAVSPQPITAVGELSDDTTTNYSQSLCN